MRLLIAIAASAIFAALYVFLLYAFATWVWPILPDWAMLIAFLLIAVLLVGSPIMALRYYGQVRSAASRARGDDEDDA